MPNNIRYVAATLLVALAGPTLAVPVTLVQQQDTWSYNTTAVDLFAGFTGRGFGDFAANFTGANTGQAAFGNSGGGVPAPNTNWAANTDLALQTTFTLSGAIIGDVTLNVAIDNGAIVFVNGTKVFAATAEGFTNIWEYTTSVSGALFNIGTNTISVLTEDHGGATYFDMEMIAADGVVVTTSPSPLVLLAAACLPLLPYARRRGILRDGRA